MVGRYRYCCSATGPAETHQDSFSTVLHGAGDRSNPCDRHRRFSPPLGQALIDGVLLAVPASEYEVFESGALVPGVVDGHLALGATERTDLRVVTTLDHELPADFSHDAFEVVAGLPLDSLGSGTTDASPLDDALDLPNSDGWSEFFPDLSA